MNVSQKIQIKRSRDYIRNQYSVPLKEQFTVAKIGAHVQRWTIAHTKLQRGAALLFCFAGFVELCRVRREVLCREESRVHQHRNGDRHRQAIDGVVDQSPLRQT